MKVESPLDLQQYELLNALLQNLASAPGSPLSGQMFFNTSEGTGAIYNGTSWLLLASRAELNAAIQGIKWKDAVQVATTANITLSGEQTIDGVTTSASRVLVKNQSTASENGIYVSASGAWTRADDANVGSELISAVVSVSEGTTLADTSWRCTNDAITLGSTSIAFSNFGTAVADATTSVKGKVQLATQAETEAKTDTDKAVTPSGLVNFVQKKAFNVGDGSSTDIVLTHNLGTRDVSVEVYTSASPYEKVLVDTENTTTNTVTLKFGTAPTSNEFRAIVKG